jgi:hypothetical protein
MKLTVYEFHLRKLKSSQGRELRILLLGLDTIQYFNSTSVNNNLSKAVY